MSALLRFDNVALRRGGRLLFDGINFALTPGDALQLSGPNGSGKSSLIRLAAGLLRAESGEIQRGPLALADDHLALDPELPLRRALGFWGGRVDAAMEEAGIAHLGKVPIRYLSSGQLKRATLARVAASGAALWLLDEPFNALDQDGASRLDAMIDTHRLNGGAVLAASHQAIPGGWSSIGLGT